MKQLLQIIATSALLLIPLVANAKSADANVQLSNAPLTIDESSFSCINEMTPVRAFFVDNLYEGKLDETLAVAKQGQGEYPAGSVVQLVPSEVMVKHPKGTNPSTNDWEFFELAVNDKGYSFSARGFDDVKNRFGGNCLDCHKKAKPEFDMVCEMGHGCDPIPITREMIKVIQKTDPRCKVKQPLSPQEIKLLKQLQAMLGG